MHYAGTLQHDATISTPPSAFLSKLATSKRTVPDDTPFEVTFSSVCIDGSNLWRETPEAALTQIIEAIRLAEQRGKSEMLIFDVTPWVNIGKGEISNVPETQERVEKLLAKACDRLNRNTPEIRLTLRGSEFDIRCYLGRDKPSDFVFESDWNSDSR